MQEILFNRRFADYLQREVAIRAAQSISNGAEIEFRIQGSSEEVFTFTKKDDRNEIIHSPAADPQLIFSMSPAAANKILANPSEKIGEIGVSIAKLIISDDPDLKVGIKIKAGFFTFLNKGYFGVLTAGGGEFASFLTSIGLTGIGAIKNVLKNMKE